MPDVSAARNGAYLPIDADQIRWLETIVAACERVLAELDPNKPSNVMLREDVEALLARTRADLERGTAM